MTKTLQGRDDERAEREEVEAQRERDAMAEEEMMRAQEMADEEQEQQQQLQQQQQQQQQQLEEGEGVVDLDADVPDADADAGGEWSDDDDDEGEEEEEVEEEEENDDEDGAGGDGHGAMEGTGAGDTGINTRTAMGMGMGMGMFDGPATPLHDDRTPQRFRLNPFQAPTAEGDGDYGSPLAARPSQRAAAARARDVSPGVVAAAAAASRRGVGALGAGGEAHVDAAMRFRGRPVPSDGPATAAGATMLQHTSSGVIEMDEADLDDAIPMDETMMEGGSYEHTDTEVEDLSSEDEGVPGGGGLGGVGSRSVFGGGGGIAAVVRRMSGADRRGSGAVGRRVSGGESRLSGGRRVSGRGRGHPGREN